MKKLILSLGFAAATVFAAQAQETQQYPESQAEDMNTQTQEQTQQQLQQEELQNQQLQHEQEQISEEEGQQTEDMNSISESELPEAVTDYIQENYEDAKVGQVYEISGNALSRIMSNRSSGSVTDAFNTPEKLFQVQVSTNQDETMMLYLTEDGKLYDRTSL